MPFGSSSGLANGAILSGDFDTFDMARIEVLRGPQGTLYGASSLGGVIKYVANEPSTDGFEGARAGSAEDVEGGGTGYSVTGVVNIPVGETFAIRASGFYRSDDGFIDSIGNNPIPCAAGPDVNIFDGTRVEDDLNSVERQAAASRALFEPIGELLARPDRPVPGHQQREFGHFRGGSRTRCEPLYGGLVRLALPPRVDGHRVPASTARRSTGISGRCRCSP